MHKPNLKQKFLEHITQDLRTEQKYYTQLGHLLIEKCLDLKRAGSNKDDLSNAKQELYRFLQKWEQYE